MDYWNIKSLSFAKYLYLALSPEKILFYVYVFCKVHYVNEYFIGHKIRLKFILFVVMFTKSFFL